MMAIFLWDCYHSFLRQTLSRNKFQTSLKYYNFFNKEKSCQICIYLFSLPFAMKLNDANNKNLWNVLAFCDQWKMMSDLNLPHTKMSDFVSFSLFRFTLAIKLQNSDFKSHWNTFFLLKKSDDRFKYVLSNSVWSD